MTATLKPLSPDMGEDVYRMLQEIADGEENIHIGCQFCDADYTFTPGEVRELLQKI